MIWQAISSDGKASEPYISNGTMDSETYLKVLKKYLISWINSNFKPEGVIFWPDLATCHYATIVQEYLRDQKIHFVPKSENAPNLPQARPIGKYWVLVKRESIRSIPTGQKT